MATMYTLYINKNMCVVQESAVEDYSDNVRQLGETARQLIADGHPESETIGVRIGQVRASSRRN